MTTCGDIIAAAQRYWRRDKWNNEYFDAAGYADFVLASRDAEVEQLKAYNETRTAEVLAATQRLAAEQAKSMQLREALESCGFDDDSTDPEMCGPYYDAELVHSALSIPSDTAALEAIIKKAGEVMRERCTSESCRSHEYDATKAIRALPGVTLGDLK